LISQLKPLLFGTQSLYILHVTSGFVEIYFSLNGSVNLMEQREHSVSEDDVITLIRSSPSIPWAILVDQSEESFWGGAMPALKGEAQSIWIDRMAQQSGFDSPYKWSELQGKSQSQPDKVRILGFSLGRVEELTQWVGVFKVQNVPFCGIYAPVLLTPTVLQYLGIKASKSDSAIVVLVTPHALGLRQTVLIENRVRFSRLAINTRATGGEWFESVYEEIAKLREYLISNGLLKNDRAGMQIKGLLPLSTDKFSVHASPLQHNKDQYEWLETPNPTAIYATALARNLPWKQLAPSSERKTYLTKLAIHWLKYACIGFSAVALIYLLWAVTSLWLKYSAIDVATIDAGQATRQYQSIARTFMQTPLTSSQLENMNKYWNAIESAKSSDMSEAMSVAGNALERHPAILLESFEWYANAAEVLGTEEAQPPIPPKPGEAKKDPSALLLRGTIRGIASDDLRGTRDLLSRFEQEFAKHPKYQVQVVKRPLDLSAKAALTGSSTQDKSELNFEIKLWPR
jgi:hypothetical protein